jgi:predicted  nucleic acid-binding Zn-ribbon protein
MFDLDADTIKALATGATGGLPITGTLLIALLSLKKSFDRFNDRVEAFDKRVDAFGKQVESFGTKVEAFDSRIDEFDDKVDAFGREVASFGIKVDAFDGQVQTFNRELRAYTDRLIRVETVVKEKISEDMSDLKERVRSLEAMKAEWRQ